MKQITKTLLNQISGGEKSIKVDECAEAITMYMISSVVFEKMQGTTGEKFAIVATTRAMETMREVCPDAAMWLYA